jgi:hypothetical protein
MIKSLTSSTACFGLRINRPGRPPFRDAERRHQYAEESQATGCLPVREQAGDFVPERSHRVLRHPDDAGLVAESPACRAEGSVSFDGPSIFCDNHHRKWMGHSSWVPSLETEVGPLVIIAGRRRFGGQAGRGAAPQTILRVSQL